MQLGILNQMPTPKNMTAEQTVQHTLSLVELAEGWGYSSYWFAEHHGTKGMASSSPEIMMAAAASRTKQIQVGSGGILLPQYSPYKVASQLLQLEALFPGRIEAGVGRSPGGNETIRSLLANGKENEMGIFQQKVQQLQNYVHGNTKIRATPRTQEPPRLYVLGLGPNSAKLANDEQVGYVFGHFIQPEHGVETHQTLRELHHTHDIKTAVFVICGKDNEHAEKLALSQDLWLLNVEKGLDSRIPSYEEASRQTFSLSDQKKIKQNRKRMIIGGPKRVKEAMKRLVDDYQSESFLLVASIYDPLERERSFKRIIELF
ncbi:MsnO8 family LLM class oxidoreductase [Geomicrobium sediminis]|uniref:Luciferase family oxidoreductase group 1 n=1 Tax=Geomicrobium sediminis TaxID=1347788 RepID=A0ABS2PI10_9BACL|nr:MsnO8 family LLM class oxidoreductase [Geomicrobium sediminis]MBM7634741.1 luciferase family oxidoreductase group 1 [Geomicrobium sediminis]